MENEVKYNLIVILGPTASGKTSLAVRLAYEIRSEIISADSRQIYRGMDIGTGKELEEYIVEGREIPYHLIDIIDPSAEFNLFEYQKRCYEIIDNLLGKNNVPILVGGTGLYLESILLGYDLAEVPVNEILRDEVKDIEIEALAERLKAANPNLHNTTDLKDRNRIIRALEIADFECSSRGTLVKRPPVHPLVIGIRWDRKKLRERITKRLRDRLESGMIDEVKSLHESGIDWDKLDFFGLEYRYVSLYLQGKLNRNDMFQKLNSAIHQFAKKQETWFRRMEKKGIKIHWVDDANYDMLRGIVRHELSL